jgi:glycosyltransferase involved in cell wall biosynthesis
MNNLAILLPIYLNDKADYLKQTINSLRDQTFKNFDVIFLIDGPISNELNDLIIETKDINAIILRFDKNRGLPSVLNDGIEYCIKNNYQFIGRIDADDIALPDRFEKQMKYLIENVEIDVVGGAIEEIDEMGNSYGKVIHYPLDHKSCYKFFKRRDPLAHPAVLFRNTFFKKAGLYNKEYIKNQDTVLWLEGFKNGCKFANLEDIVLKFRMDSFFFRKRRGGFKRAKELLLIRIKVSKELNYGIIGIFYAIILFSITIAPTFIRKITYKYLR